MKAAVSSILIFPLIALIVFAQEAVTVDRVDFNSLRDDWVQMEIKLSCNGDSNGKDARARRYVEEIKVKAYIAYGEPGEFDFYTSELEIIIMEQGDDNNVYFYLPGLIVERDQLPTRPEYYYVEISVGGVIQQPGERTAAMSSKLTSLERLNNFLSAAGSESAENEDILMPIYLVSGIDLGRVDKLPAFLRRDVRD